MSLIYSVLATLVVSLISFLGILVLYKSFYTRRNVITMLIAFATGSLLGDVFFHIFPDYLAQYNYSSQTAFLILLGLFAMFLVEAYFHCAHEEIEKEEDKRKFVIGRMGVLGDVIHNFLDGVAIAASFIASVPTGFITTFAIIFHEIPKEISNVSLLTYTGWGKRKILFVNFLTALASVIGALVTFALATLVSTVSLYLLPIVIGQFLYISLADLLPEIHKKTNFQKYVTEIIMFLAGVSLMYLLTFLS